MAMPRKSRAGLERAPHGRGTQPSARPPADVVAERNARLGYVETIGTAVLGDPPPGRSALDGYVHRGDSSGQMRERW
jgi:hypothetical protein